MSETITLDANGLPVGIYKTEAPTTITLDKAKLLAAFQESNKQAFFKSYEINAAMEELQKAVDKLDKITTLGGPMALVHFVHDLFPEEAEALVGDAVIAEWDQEWEQNRQN